MDTKTEPRILLLTSQYFLSGELRSALERMGVEHRLMDLATREMDLDEFVALMAGVIQEFKPDFVLTVNHLGVDREGVLMQILDRYDVPLVSWFVDNPFLILGVYNNLHGTRQAIFTWDSDNVDALEKLGFDNVFHLPLGCDPHRFVPGRIDGPDEWRAKVSFVGNSMKTKCEKRFHAANPGFNLVAESFEMAEKFNESEDRIAAEFLLREYPHLQDDLAALGPARRLAFETYVTWLATCLYRRDCIVRTMPYEPIIVGDRGWDELYKHFPGWRRIKELNYYDELPDFYPLSRINFNATSKQMKGAVNQRVFDVPCCGAFLLTDYRAQIEELFEPENEIVFYRDPEEIPELIDRYLDDPQSRLRIATAARERILHEHTYDHRMRTLIDTVRETFL